MSKYEFVKEQIKERLQTGQIRPGGRLPSIREISRQFACSRNTAIRAYADLEREHLIYAVPKSGYYAVLRSSQPDDDQTGWIDFAAASPDPAVMPYKDFQHCLNRAIELYQDQLFSYADPQGFFSLRRALEKHLAGAQVFAAPEQISVVSGAQQALYLLASMPFPNGKSAVLVEQPTYHGMLHALDLLGVTAIGITRSAEGIDLDELERHFRNNHIKFFYTVPRYHNPLGTSYTQAQKKQIARLAAKYDVYLVEDDYLADMETGRKADPIFTYDDSAHTVYIKSFSKIMLPGLRLAAVVLPKAMVEAFRLWKAACDSSTAILSQAALEIYLTCGMYERHAAFVRERYQARMHALREACGRYLPQEIRIDVPDGGIFTRLLLPGQIDSDELAASLRQQQVLVRPVHRCFLRTHPKENGLRISIIRTDEKQVERGMQLLGETVDRFRSQKRPVQTGRAVEWI
ncbi:PLP-dependent aminotransferase family protein [Brevibacillus sp. SYP-B805]|uniref:aminotransferase class I/II-fold pyridoxal phosphate-dependent enzyme n=1 Tax=Brevibacillus sp. SYP-B805 TaxID=1578199 RepID=UPI0013E9A63E|nr:PLP-dependent aminotransferase family protein [Brevibacillus sp. SYP-B805]